VCLFLGIPLSSIRHKSHTSGRITFQGADQPGVGRLLVVAVSNRDLAVVQVILLLVALTMVAANFMVDLAYGIFDPRIKQAAPGGAK